MPDMNASHALKPIIGKERTLVITCLECSYEIEQNGAGQVFRYTTLGNMLNPLNEIEMDNLKSFINFKKCTKIIIAGHHHCRALEYIRCEVNAESPIFNLRETLRELYGNNHGSLITKWHGETMLTELNVIEQCKKLMTLPFVREKFENGEIGVLGVIIFRHGEIKKVFNNGIAYNDVISLN